MKTICIIDAGGRGAALVHAYSKSPHVGKILAIPGNDYVQENSLKHVITFPNIKVTSVSEIVEICKKEKVDFVDVAPDPAIAVGLVDALQKEGFTVFGPTQKAGEIEWNKAFAREFMARHNIPQPEFYVFHNVKDGIEFLYSQPDQPWFVKASGLAEGKGALPAKNNKEAKERVKELQRFGKAGETYLLEKWLRNGTEAGFSGAPAGFSGAPAAFDAAEEFSAFAISDGNSFQIIGFAQDHKRALDADKGENTGGMGCSTPPLVVDENIKRQTYDIFQKTFNGLKKEGRQYKGILYLGGIIIREKDKEQRANGKGKKEILDAYDKVYVVEFNARWGDPEVEVILPGIKNDYFDIAMAVVKEKLSTVKLETDGKARVIIAGCAKGYPLDYSGVKGKEIIGLEKAKKLPGIIIYGAGIKLMAKSKEKKEILDTRRLRLNAKYIVNGGRVFYIVGEGKNVVEARKSAYKAIKLVSIEGNNLHYRTDIGWRDVKRVSV